MRVATLAPVVWSVMWVGVVARPASADDVQLESDTSFHAYEVQSPGTATFLTRRRLVQSLGFRYVRAFDPDEPEERRIGPRVSARLRLRLDHDFGDTCLVARDLCVRATDESDPSVFSPLATDTLLDAPEVWVEVGGLPWGARVRAGRQLRFSALGLSRIDGASALVAPLRWLSVEAWGGALVRRTSVGGTGAFEPEASLRLDPPDEPPPWLVEPTTTWTVGTALSLGLVRYVRGRLSFRERFEADGLSDRAVGLGLTSQPIDALTVRATGVLDLATLEVADATATVAWTIAERLHLETGVEHHLPRFDRGTIWSYFDPVPVSDARVGADWDVTDRLEVGASLRGRRADFGDGDDELDAGGEGRVRVRVAGFDLRLSAFVWGGDLGPVAAVLFDGERPIANRIRAGLRASVWHFDDPLRQGLYGTSISEAATLRYDITELTTVRATFEHAYSRVAGHRFRGLASLHLEVWR